jgi:hypothetical protein
MSQEPEQPELVWEKVPSARKDQKWYHGDWEIHRAKVPGGWLVITRVGGEVPQGIAFYPDPEHKWNGGSVP